MWTCEECNADVEDKFENCPLCGTGRDGSEPPVDFVKKKDALQPGLPATDHTASDGQKRLVTVLIVLIVIITLVIVAVM